MLKQNLELFEDRVKQNIDELSAGIYYKQMLLDHGTYHLFNVVTNNVCAAGVINNGCAFGSSHWAKIEMIAYCKYEVGYGIFLMKHMFNTTKVERIFIYAITDRQLPLNETRLRVSNKINGKFPFYEKYGFWINYDMHRDLRDYMPYVTAAMLATKSLVTSSLRSGTNVDHEHTIFTLIYILFIQLERI